MRDPKERKNVTVDSLVRVDISKNPDRTTEITDYVEEVIDENEFNSRGILVKTKKGKTGHAMEVIDFVEAKKTFDEEKVEQGEGQKIEFKSTFSFDEDAFKKSGFKYKNSNEELMFRIPKTIVAFSNSEGGILYIGLEDRTGIPLGLENDYEVLKVDQDGFEQKIIEIIEKHIPEKGIISKLGMKMINYKGHDVYRIIVKPNKETPRICFRDANLKAKGNKLVKVPFFYVRVGNTSRHQTPLEFINYWIEYVNG